MTKNDVVSISSDNLARRSFEYFFSFLSLPRSVHPFKLLSNFTELIHFFMSSFSSIPWGYLEPINHIYPRGILTKSSYIIGRHPNECDIILDSDELRQNEYFIHISSKHFLIECTDHGRSIIFHDISRNGCYIDGELVHQLKISLQNNEHTM